MAKQLRPFTHIKIKDRHVFTSCIICCFKYKFVGIRMILLKQVLKSRSKIKEMILIFLLGFFVGGILFFSFRSSYEIELVQLETGLSLWALKEEPFLRIFIMVLWDHAQGFLLMWLLSVTKISLWYTRILFSFRGFGYGFCFGFFIASRGFGGMLRFFQSLFPQVFFFVPMYLFLVWYFFCETTKRKQGLAVLISSLLLLLGCFMECRFNIPLMQNIYK